jgi:hypothetical protein
MRMLFSPLLSAHQGTTRFLTILHFRIPFSPIDSLTFKKTVLADNSLPGAFLSP